MIAVIDVNPSVDIILSTFQSANVESVYVFEDVIACDMLESTYPFPTTDDEADPSMTDMILLLLMSRVEFDFIVLEDVAYMLAPDYWFVMESDELILASTYDFVAASYALVGLMILTILWLERSMLTLDFIVDWSVALIFAPLNLFKMYEPLPDNNGDCPLIFSTI